MALRPTIKQTDSISVHDLIEMGGEQLKLTVVTGHKGIRLLIRDKSINRPALALTGYFKNFASRRIQLFGAGEMAYLRDQTEECQIEIMQAIVARHVPCIIISRHLTATRAMKKVCAEHQVPLLRTPLSSRDFMAVATIFLEDYFAPQVCEHGTLMDVKGIGILIRGASGIGKSECAISLVSRGYSLVADDMVYIKLMNERELVGTGPEMSRGYMEVRGLGIVSVVNLFGIRSIRPKMVVDMVVTFEEWKPGMEERRTGLERDYYPILGQKVPHIIFPVRPGRDLGRLVEVASMLEANRKMGHDCAAEFNDRLIASMAAPIPPATH